MHAAEKPATYINLSAQRILKDYTGNIPCCTCVFTAYGQEGSRRSHATRQKEMIATGNRSALGGWVTSICTVIEGAVDGCLMGYRLCMKR